MVLIPPPQCHHPLEATVFSPNSTRCQLPICFTFPQVHPLLNIYTLLSGSQMQLAPRFTPFHIFQDKSCKTLACRARSFRSLLLFTFPPSTSFLCHQNNTLLFTHILGTASVISWCIPTLHAFLHPSWLSESCCLLWSVPRTLSP